MNWIRRLRIAYYAWRVNRAIDDDDAATALQFWVLIHREQARQAAAEHFRRGRVRL